MSEGWYDPSTLQKAQDSAASYGNESRSIERSKLTERMPSPQRAESGLVDEDRDSDSGDSVGPTLPGQESRPKSIRMGPSIPNMQDLELMRGIQSQTSRY